MSAFALDDLMRLLASDPAHEEADDLTEAALDEDFTELGYDSLALLELLSKVQREYGLKLPDDAVEQMSTPRSAIDLINAKLPGVKAVSS